MLRGLCSRMLSVECCDPTEDKWIKNNNNNNNNKIIYRALCPLIAQSAVQQSINYKNIKTDSYNNKIN